MERLSYRNLVAHSVSSYLYQWQLVFLQPWETGIGKIT